jgi:hypothetical protein
MDRSQVLEKYHMTISQYTLTRIVQWFNAAKRGDLQLIFRLLSEGIPRYITDDNHETILFLAVKYRQVEIIQFLLNYDYEVNISHPFLVDESKQLINIPNNRYETPIHLAVSMNDSNLINLLSKSKIPVNYDFANYLNLSPLHTAVQNQSYKIVLFLLAHGAKPDVIANMYLGRYSLKENKNIHQEVKLLYGQTPLDMCHENNPLHDDIRSILIRYGATSPTLDR